MKKRFLINVVAILAILCLGIAKVYATETNITGGNDDSSQNVGLYLNPTLTDGNPTKDTTISQDLSRVWYVVFNTTHLVWNVTQSQTGEIYHYTWDPVSGSYNYIVDVEAGSTIETTLTSSADKTVTITNKSNFDVTPAIATLTNVDSFSNLTNIIDLFTSNYTGGTLSYGQNGNATFTINEAEVESIDELINNLNSTAIDENTAYLVGNATITLTGANTLYPAEITYTSANYGTLDDAVDALAAGGKITLGENISFDANHSVTVWDKKFNLNLNGMSITTNSGIGKNLSNMGYTASAIVNASGEELSISNGTITTAYGAGIYLAGTTGTLSDLTINAAQTGAQTTLEYSSAIRLTSAATVIINSGTYSAGNGGYSLAISNSGGTAIINGGTFNNDLFFSTSSNTGVDKALTINGGVFNGGFVNFNKATSVEIKGGTFAVDPTPYVDLNNYTVTSNSNGTYTVTANN